MASDIQQTQIGHFTAFVRRLDELREFIRPMGKTLDHYLYPLQKNDKNPDTRGLSWVTDRAELELLPAAACERLMNGIGNIGLVANCDPAFDKSILSIGVLDIDLDENGNFKLPEELVYQLIDEMNSFTVRTRSGGFHIYFVADGSMTNGFYEKFGVYNPLPKYAGVIFGELRLFHQYVVGVGSYVPTVLEKDKKKSRPDATGFYEVYRDVAIRIVNRQTFPSWIELGNSSSNVPNTRYEHITISRDKIATYATDAAEHDMTKIVNAAGNTLHDVVQRETTLAHLLASSDNVMTDKSGAKKSRSEADFTAIRLLKAYGFDAEQTWVIMRTFRPYEKTFRDDYLDKSISKVYGQVDEIDTTKIVMKEMTDDTEEIQIDTFPEDIPNDKRVAHVVGLPRTGKSYNCVRIMGRYGNGLFVCPNHEIMNQQFATFCRLHPDRTATKTMGKLKACNHPDANGRKCNCSECPYKPHHNRNETDGDEQATGEQPDQISIISHWQMQRDARELVATNKHIDLDTIPDYYCKYYMLHYCKFETDFVFTIPYYTFVDDDFLRIDHREICVLDEDTTFRAYKPTDLSIAEYGHYNSGRTNIVNNLAPCLPTLQFLEEAVTTVKTKNDDGERVKRKKQRMQKTDNIILGVIYAIREMHNIIEQFRNNVTVEQFDEMVASIRSMKINIRGTESPVTDADDDLKRDVLRQLSKYERNIHTGTDSGIAAIFEPFLYPYRKNALCVIGDNPKRFILVGDGEQIIYDLDCADKYIFIGFTEARLFANQMFPEPKDRVRLRVAFFPYGKNFNLFTIKKYGKEPKQARRKAMTTFIRAMNEENKVSQWKTPFMILTASQMDQESVWATNYSDEVYMTRQDNIDKLKAEWLNGRGLAFYQNSTISRGIDVPWNDIMVVNNCVYSQPYWAAVIQYHEAQIEIMDEDILNLMATRTQAEETNDRNVVDAIANQIHEIDLERQKHYDAKNNAEITRISILMDETTNSCLRPTPVNEQRDDQCKFIFMIEDDLIYLNDDAKREMTKYDIYGTHRFKEIIALIKECASATDPQLIADTQFFVSGAHTKSITDETVTRIESQEPTIRWGMSIEQANVLLKNYSGDTTTDDPDTAIHPTVIDSESVQEIARYMINYPNFSYLAKAGSQKSKSIKSNTLVKWATNRLKNKPFTSTDYANAIQYIIRKKWVTVTNVETIRKRAIKRKTTEDIPVPLGTDIADTVYTLVMLDHNRETFRADTGITIVVK